MQHPQWGGVRHWRGGVTPAVKPMPMQIMATAVRGWPEPSSAGRGGLVRQRAAQQMKCSDAVWCSAALARRGDTGSAVHAHADHGHGLARLARSSSAERGGALRPQ